MTNHKTQPSEPTEPTAETKARVEARMEASAGESDQRAFGDNTQAWFDEAGTPHGDHELDPGLTRLEPHEDIGQKMVLVAIAFMCLYFGFEFRSEFLYALTEPEPIALNDPAVEYELNPALLANGGLSMPSNAHAQVRGVGERRATSGKNEFFKLAGAHLYVQREVVDDRPRLLGEREDVAAREVDSFAMAYDGTGRLLAFDGLPRRYQGLVHFYSDNFGLQFCGYEASETVASFQYRLTQEARQRFSEEHGRMPTDAELAAVNDPRASCVVGYLLIDGATPSGYWYYPVLYVGLLAGLAGSVFFLARRPRRRSRPNST